MDKKQTIEFIKANPQLSYEEFKIQAQNAGMDSMLFDEAWQEAHSTKSKKNIITIVSILLVMAILIIGFLFKNNNGCESGYSIDEFGNCSLSCTGKPEVCNARDDDCDTKIDEDDVCVIDPLSFNGSIVRAGVNTVEITIREGYVETVAHNQLLVTVDEALTPADFVEALAGLQASPAVVIGQIQEMNWYQIAVEDASALSAVKVEIEEWPSARQVEYNHVMVSAFWGN